MPIIVNAVNDPVTARDDAFFPNENLGTNANILVNNPDGDAFSVTAVNGVAATSANRSRWPRAHAHAQCRRHLLLRPERRVRHLCRRPAPARPTTATDSFTYTVTGGDTATVTIAITGVDIDDILRGTGGNNTLTGGVGNDRVLRREPRRHHHRDCGAGRSTGC